MRVKKGKWKCSSCNKQKVDTVSSVDCNLCTETYCIECSDFNQEVFDYLKSQKVEVTFICNHCKESLPELRNILEITKKQQKLMEDIDAHDTRITKCEVNLTEVTQKQTADNQLLKDLNTRLGDLEAKVISSETVETIATKCFKKADFPSLKEVERKQFDTNKKLEETLESHTEQKLRAEKEKSLIVFGIPEEQDTAKEAQMKSDFLSIKNLYSDRVQLECNDITQIIRIGTIKPNQTRPIKITFHCIQKRQQVLRNNKNLIINGDEFEECTSHYCDETGEHHQHIYVNTDKTKKQIADEKKLREELKTRKQHDPELVIRNGKIVNKTDLHARWSQITKDGL